MAELRLAEQRFNRADAGFRDRGFHDFAAKPADNGDDEDDDWLTPGEDSSR